MDELVNYEVLGEANGGGSVDNNMFHSDFPPGYRFRPTDEELVVYYLKNQVLKKNLPYNNIRKVKLYSYNPKQLSEMFELHGEEEWYFFTQRKKKYLGGTRPNRAAGNGFWKATGADTPICSNNITVGYKKSLVFYEGNAKSGVKTNWLMQEYKLDRQKWVDLVLCKVYQKKIAVGNPTNNQQQQDEEETGEMVHEEGLPNAEKKPEQAQAPLPPPLPSGMDNMSGGIPSSSGPNYAYDYGVSVADEALQFPEPIDYMFYDGMLEMNGMQEMNAIQGDILPGF